MSKYDSSTHHHCLYGYNNPETAIEFASWVIQDLVKNYGEDIKTKDVYFVGIDGSSTFLAAFILAQNPQWKFLPGKKHLQSVDISGNSITPDLIVFVDDYFSSGNSLEITLTQLSKYHNSDQLKLDNGVKAYYIKASCLLEGFEYSNYDFKLDITVMEGVEY